MQKKTSLIVCGFFRDRHGHVSGDMLETLLRFTVQ